MRADNPFAGRLIWIVTRHKKEQAIAPVLTRMLGACCRVLNTINTDLFGTFTGEIPRIGTPLDAARQKCKAGANAVASDNLVLASEGSFGPHPHIPFAPANEEWLLLTEPSAGREWHTQYLTLKTNYAAMQVKSWDELRDFALKAGFPQHALILRIPGKISPVIKGLQSWVWLKYHYRRLASLHPCIGVETDMRALYNPTRMEAIAKATRRLAARLLSKCPRCRAPGFAETAVVTGLPCGWCGEPTKLVKSLIFTCNHCGWYEERPRPDAARTADAMYCNLCNP